MADMTVSKILSPNDSGETGAHQAGILIPKTKNLLSFFPALPEFELNPRSLIDFEDQTGRVWRLAFIYYNNKYFGGTRNEYRLTRMTRYIRQSALVAGDEIIMRRSSSRNYYISYRRTGQTDVSAHLTSATMIRLSGGWRIVKI